jgi:hypothetical protein
VTINDGGGGNGNRHDGYGTEAEKNLMVTIVQTFNYRNQQNDQLTVM